MSNWWHAMIACLESSLWFLQNGKEFVRTWQAESTNFSFWLVDALSTIPTLLLSANFCFKFFTCSSFSSRHFDPPPGWLKIPFNQLFYLFLLLMELMGVRAVIVWMTKLGMMKRIFQTLDQAADMSWRESPMAFLQVITIFSYCQWFTRQLSCSSYGPYCYWCS